VSTTVAREETGSVSATGGSARSQLYDLRERSWKPRPVVSGAIVAVSFVIPVVAAVITVQVAARAVPRPSGPLAVGAWILALVALASATMWAIDKLSRRLLPLAAMLRLSLVFPDSAPSRFSVALKRGSGKALERSLERASTESEFATSRHAAALVVGLINTVSTHDRMTRGHSERVRAYADLIGEELGLDAESRNKLHWAALLHDVGKLDVPASILNKADKLTAEEWQVIRSHPAASDRWLVPVRAWLGPWARAASEHHERYDGDGYPNGLQRDEISLAGRIVAVADAFDVMTAARSYKKPYPAAQARVELANNAGTQFDPKVVRAFLAISLSRLRLVMGPLAWLSGLSGMVSVGSVASGAAAAVTATVVAASALAAPAAASTRHNTPHAVTASAPASETSARAPGIPNAPSGAGADVPGNAKAEDGTATDTVPVTPISVDPGAPEPRDASGNVVPRPVRRPDNSTVSTTPGATTPSSTPDATVAPVPDDTTPATSPTTTPASTVVSTPATSPAPIANAPVAHNDTTGTLLNKDVLIDVLANDTDADGNIDPARLAIVTLPATGYQQIQVVNNEIRVQVQTLYTGTLVFTYKVCDTTNLCSVATVKVTFLAAL
jgi:hypothetical protein